jgi:hypothetical protein
VELLEQWELIEFSFHAVLGVDLEEVWSVKSWRWFTVRLRGFLMDPDSLLSRCFRTDDDEQPTPEVFDD